jgi:hypothetical protein
MGQRFELSISPDYVPDWKLTDAIREIFQNALDQQTVNPENKMDWDFSVEDECFWISSKDSKLTKDTLLFGCSSKTDDYRTIGTFGEGYKLALLVLTRLKYKVKIYNHADGEVWTPKIINSRRYGGKILVIDIEKHIFSKTPDNNLTFMIDGVDAADIADIGLTNLHMKKPKKTIETSFGHILCDDRHKGKVFVNGLFISKQKNYKYGYDVKPEFLTIGRDRNLINSFDLSWLTSRMWLECNKPGVVSKLVHENAADTIYVGKFSTAKGELAQTMYAEFIGTYGKLAVPVSSQEEYDTVKKSYKKLRPIIVKEHVIEIIRGCASGTMEGATRKRDTRTPQEILKDFKKKCTHNLTTDLKNEFDRIIKKSYNWTFK